MTDTQHNDFMIDAAELARLIEDRAPRLRLVDASWYLPAMNRDGRAEYERHRIPTAQFFDIDAIADTSTDLPHMLPEPDVFARAVGEMGIGETDDIIIYDGPGLFSSARVWWTFRTMGARNVRILAGGMDGWIAAGLPVETGPPTANEPASFKAGFDPEKVRDHARMLANVRKGESLVLDARPFARFTGEAPEPRPGLKSGHMPGARSLPSSELVRDGRLLPQDELVSRLRIAGVRQGRHVTTSCGSGVTAAILSLALETIGHDAHSLYDGSWADWGSREESPLAIWK